MTKTEKIESNTYHFIYLTTNLINSKKYLGKHSTNNLEDGYIGDGVVRQSRAKRKSGFQGAVAKYGYENFKREILRFYNSSKEAYRAERLLSKLIDIVNDKNFYNLRYGGEGNDFGKYSYHYGRKRKQETIDKIVSKNKGRKRSKEQIEAHRLLMTGKKFSKETSDKHKETWKKIEDVTCPWCGKVGRGGIMIRYHFDNCKKNSNYVKKEIVCPHCGYIGTSMHNMKRFHFENCKLNFNAKKIVCPHCFAEGVDEKIMHQFHFDNCVRKEDPKLFVCPHCGKSGKRLSSMKMWHFDNCKENPKNNKEEIAIRRKLNHWTQKLKNK